MINKKVATGRTTKEVSSAENIQPVIAKLQDIAKDIQAITGYTVLDPETVVKQIEGDFELSSQIDSTVKTHIAARVEPAKKFIQQAKQAFAAFNPSKVSLEIRKSITYLGKGDDLKKAQSQIITEDFQSLNKFEPKTGLTLHISDSEQTSLGLSLDKDSKLTNKVIENILDFYKNRMKGFELYAQFNSLALCKAKLEAEKTIEEITGVKPAPSISTNDDGNDKLSPASTAAKLAKDQVGVQMQYTTSPETRVLFGVEPRATQEDLQKAAESFELRGGPADVTAYHDFYDLQIAFRHVWTELFDQELAKQGTEMYEEYIKLKEGLGDTSPTNTITTWGDYLQLKEELLKLRLTITENDERLNKVMQMLPDVTKEKWAKLEDQTKQSLFEMAQKFEKIKSEGGPMSHMDSQSILFNAVWIFSIAIANVKKTRVEHFLGDLEKRISEKYTFDVFAPKSFNFGILVTYRQEWKPLKYQVGELVSTIPLAPKEVRKYSTRKIVKKNRAEKEIEDALQIRKHESANTARDHAEIIQKAQDKTNFKHNAEGSVNLVLWNAKGSHSIEMDKARHSSQVKKEFRESVLKAAEEYKNEHRLEIDTTTSEETEITTSGEISNPNDELPVTYLFYELERCYEISEKIHKLTPVILVANDVPYPSDIDEDWLLTHDWILRRCILDDSFKKALDYLSDTYVSDEISIEVLRNNLATQLKLVEDMGRNVASSEEALQVARQAMGKAVEKYSETLKKEDKGVLKSVHNFFFGGDADLADMLRVRMEAAKETFQRAERDLVDLRSQLGREITALEAATDKYCTAIQKQFDRRTEILRLRAHVKDNILYYMQCIWDQEPPDQRFFRLYDQIEVPMVDWTDFEYKASLYSKSWLTLPGEKSIKFKIKAPNKINIKMKKLVEVADLDNPLGYKGNYTIFPLKENNAITDFMMQDYVEVQEFARLKDPDEFGEYTSDDLRELLKCMVKQDSGRVNDAFKKKIKDALISRLSDPHPDKEMVIVPTTSLYIEALPGKHPILEDFKLVHRAVDVKKAQADVRHAELENVRIAARVLKGEYEDPDIEKKIIVTGNKKDVNVNT